MAVWARVSKFQHDEVTSPHCMHTAYFVRAAAVWTKRKVCTIQLRDKVCFHHLDELTDKKHERIKQTGTWRMFCIIMYSCFICDFPKTLLYNSILLHTMHVIKVQWINFKDRKSKKKRATQKNRRWFWPHRETLVKVLYACITLSLLYTI